MLCLVGILSTCLSDECFTCVVWLRRQLCIFCISSLFRFVFDVWHISIYICVSNYTA